MRLVNIPATSPHEHLELSPVADEVIGHYAAQNQTSALLIRRQLPYVLLGPKDRRLPALTRGIQWLNDQGFPVYSRLGGGSAVLLDQDCLSFAVARPCRDLTVWEQNFREMAQGAIRGLQELGLPVEFGRSSGSYCEGPFDLVIEGVKVAGIAQAIRQGFALVSGMILVKQDGLRTTRLLQEFYRQSGSPLQLDPKAVTAITDIPGYHDMRMHDVRQALIEGFSQEHILESQPFTDAEWQHARTIISGRKTLPDTNDAKEMRYASYH